MRKKKSLASLGMARKVQKAYLKYLKACANYKKAYVLKEKAWKDYYYLGGWRIE